mmetsp:Transcript_10777/g.20859  ORF Transcript_10777/g.20859 Transcript_10777/m.20859 type:complete len:229 (+) Transcript_10777:720-1406(+)
MVGLKALVVPPSLHTRVSPYPRQRMQRGALAAVFSGLAGGGVEGLTRMISSTSKQRGRERGRERRDGLDETGRRWGRQIVVKERRRKREGKERERWKPNVGRSHSFFFVSRANNETNKQTKKCCRYGAIYGYHGLEASHLRFTSFPHVRYVHQQHSASTHTMMMSPSFLHSIGNAISRSSACFDFFLVSVFGMHSWLFSLHAFMTESKGVAETKMSVCLSVLWSKLWI